MKCPTCNLDLQMTERQGVEIDYCPQCRGVWLDRGELDKIIERSLSVQPIGSALPDRSRRESDRREDWDDDDDYKRRRRKSFLSELFDF
jgi:Zn-finger nucleic acid-binding protein